MANVPCIIVLLITAIIVNYPVTTTNEKNVESVLQPYINQFKVNLQKSMEESRIRRKRSNSYSISFDPVRGFEEDHISIPKIDLEDITTWTSVEGRNKFMLAWALKSGDLRLAEFHGPYGGAIIRRRYHEDRYPDSTPTLIRYFVEDRSLNLVVVWSSKKRSDIAIYQETGRDFNHLQVIQTSASASVDLLQVGRKVYLAIGHASGVRIMTWTSTQFDEVASKSLLGVHSVKLIRVNSEIFLATSQTDPTTPYNSPLFVYEPETDMNGELRSRQFLDTKFNYSQVNHFRIGGSDYLIYSGSDSSLIFWWSLDGFLEYQSLAKTEGASKIVPLTLSDGEVLLAAIFKDRISFFTQSMDAHFVPIYHHKFPSRIRDLHLATFAGRFIYAFLSFENPVLSPLWKVRLIPVVSSGGRLVMEPQDDLFKCLSGLGLDVRSRDQKLKELSDKAGRVWVKDRPQVISAPVIVEGSVRVTGEVPARIHHLVITHGKNVTYVPQLTNSQIRDRLAVVGQKVAAAAAQLPSMARRDKSNVIHGKVTFSAPIIVKSGYVKTISNPDVAVNGLPFLDIKDKVLKVTGDQTITGMWTFNNGLKTDQLFVGGRVNGFKIDDILLKDSENVQVVSGRLTFRNLTVDSNVQLPPTGSINRIFLRDIVTTNHREPITISGRKRLASANVTSGNFDVKETVNGRNLGHFVKTAIRLNSVQPQIINSDITFANPSMTFNRLQVNGLINGVVNVSHLHRHSVSKTRPGQLVTGRKTIHGSVHVEGDVEVTGTVNGLRIPEDIVTINRPQTILAPLIFKGPVRIRGDLATETVNGIDFSAEVVLKNSVGPQVVTGRKGFLQGLTVKGNITMDEKATLDGVDPSELAKQVMHRSTINGPLYFDQLKVNGDVIAKKGINGHSISDLPNVIWLKSANQTMSTPVTFLSAVEVDSLSTTSINGLKFPGDFLLKDSKTEQLVTGHKTFVGDVNLPNSGLTTDPGVKVNGVDIDAVNRQMVKNLPVNESIHGVKSFDHLIVKGNIIAAKVNGLDFSKDVMLNNVRQTVESAIIFASAETTIRDRLTVDGDIHVRELTNGVKLSEWFKSVVHVGSTDRRPITNKRFKALHAGKVAAAGNIAGINIHSFREKVVTLDTDQVITGRKTFMEELAIDSDLDVGFLNGLNVSDLASRIVYKDQPAVITGRKTILGQMIVDKSDLEIGGKVNGVDLGKLAADAVYLNRDNLISGHMTFAQGVRMDNLKVRGHLDGIDFNDLVYLDRDADIQTPIVFEDAVTIEGNMTVADHKINDCDLRRLVNESVRLDVGSVVIHGRKFLTSLNVDKDLNISATINRVHLPTLAGRIVTLDSPQVITGPITFTDTVTVDNLYILANVSGVNIHQILKDSVRKSIPQVIRGKKIFAKGVTVTNGRATIFKDVAVKGLVNGVNLTNLDLTTAKKDRNQVIQGVKTLVDARFEGDVTISGRLGHGRRTISIPRDLVLLNEEVEGPPLPPTILLNDTHVRRDLNVHGLIDGVNVTDFATRRTSLTHNQTIPGVLEFTNPITIRRLVVRKTINGIPVADIVTRTGNHTLRGSYKFLNGLQVTKNLLLDPRATINGVSLEEIAAKAIDVTKGGRIPGRTFITNFTEISGLDTRRLNGLIVQGMVRDYNDMTSTVGARLRDYQNRLNNQGQVISATLAQLDGHATSLNYFEVWTEFDKDPSSRNHVEMSKFLVVPTNDQFKVENSSSYVDYPIASKVVYWKLRGLHESNPSCPVFGSVVSSFDPKQRSLLKIGENKRPMTPVYGLKSVDPFFVWFNDSDCSRSRQILVGSLVDKMDILQAGPLFTYPMVEAMSITDAQGFSTSGDDYLVVTLDNRLQARTPTVIFRFVPTTNTWVVHQEIVSHSPSAIDILETSVNGHHQILLVVANRLVHQGSHSPSVIYSWDMKTRLFTQHQAVNSWTPSDVIFITGDGETFLVVANEKAKLYGGQCDFGSSQFGDTSSSFFTQSVDVYQLRPRLLKFELVQSIHISGVTSLDRIHLPPNQSLLVIGSQMMGKTFVYQLRGVNLFQEVTNFNSPGVVGVKSFWTRDGQLMVAVASRNAGQSKILRAILDGPSPRLRRNSPFVN